jgi:hypothetical protein
VSPARLAGVLAAASVLLAGGCALGPEDHPQLVQAGVAGGQPAKPGPDEKLVTIQVYLLRGDQLVRVPRTVQSGDAVAATLLALTQPLSSAETAEGLHTAIPTALMPPSGSVVGTVARVSMPSGFDRLSVHEQVAAMAQLVYTVTEDTPASSVRLVAGGREIPVPDGSGQLRDRPVGRSDYGPLAPRG